MVINILEIRKLREQTGAGVADCRAALEEAEGDEVRAKDILKQKGLNKAGSKMGREVKAGFVESYSHGGRIGVLVEVLCETDFVAKTDDFKTLVHEIALQIASMDPPSIEELLGQEYIRDSSQKVGDLVKATISRLGENIRVGKFSRIELGK